MTGMNLCLSVVVGVTNLYPQLKHSAKNRLLPGYYQGDFRITL